MPIVWTLAAASSTMVFIWKSGRVHLAEGSNVVVLPLPYILRSSGGRAESMRVGTENMENLMTVVDRLDELQASSVSRSECSSMDVHRHMQSALPTGDGLWWPLTMHMWWWFRNVCAVLSIRQTLCRHVTTGTHRQSKPQKWTSVYQSSHVYEDCTNSVPIVKNSQKQSKQSKDSQNSKNEGLKLRS